MANDEAMIEGIDWDSDLAVFRSVPSLRNYLDIREKHPGREPPNVFFSGIDPLFAMQAELEKWEIDPGLVAKVMDADAEAIDKLSLKLLALIHDRQKLEGVGETHVQSREIAVPDRLIDYLIVIMFEGMEEYDEPHVIGALNFLVRERLGGPNMAMHQAYEKKFRKDAVISMMTSARRLGMDVSIRQIAKIFGVQPSSITRLFEPGELEERIQFFLNLPPLFLAPLEGEDPMMDALPRNVRAQLP